MDRATRRPSHPLVGWAFVGLGCAGLAAAAGAYLLQCRDLGVPAWPVDREALAAIVRASLPGAVLLVVGVLLPLQRLGHDPDRRDLLSRLVTGTVLGVFGLAWMLRMNLVGFASLWARREPLGDLVLPAAVLENRVWSANIMLVFVVALASLPLNTLVRRLLARPQLPRAPWPLWLLASIWWIGLVAVLLIAGIR